jgi:hypothetical protein
MPELMAIAMEGRRMRKGGREPVAWDLVNSVHHREVSDELGVIEGNN